MRLVRALCRVGVGRAGRGAARALAVAAGCAALAAGPARARAELPAPAPVESISVTERLGVQVPLDLQFRDHRDAPVRLGDLFDGNTPVVLTLGYVRCETLCNLVLRGVANAVRLADAEPGADYRLITVTIDPRETTPESARMRGALLRQAGRDPEEPLWAYLRGDDQAVRELANAVGFGYRWDPRTEQYAHPAVAMVLDGEGRTMRYLYGARLEDGVLDGALEAARRSEAALSGQDGQSPLTCFRFDPSLRSHWKTVARYFAIGGGVLLVLVGGGIGYLIRRERQAP